MECDACSLVEIYVGSRGTCCLHILQYAQGRFLRNVGNLLRCCLLLNLRRYCLRICCSESLKCHTLERRQYLTVLGLWLMEICAKV
jgi:hypothetical protein